MLNTAGVYRGGGQGSPLHQVEWIFARRNLVAGACLANIRQGRCKANSKRVYWPSNILIQPPDPTGQGPRYHLGTLVMPRFKRRRDSSVIYSLRSEFSSLPADFGFAFQPASVSFHAAHIDSLYPVSFIRRFRFYPAVGSPESLVFKWSLTLSLPGRSKSPVLRFFILQWLKRWWMFLGGII